MSYYPCRRKPFLRQALQTLKGSSIPQTLSNLREFQPRHEARSSYLVTRGRGLRIMVGRGAADDVEMPDAVAGTLTRGDSETMLRVEDHGIVAVVLIGSGD